MSSEQSAKQSPTSIETFRHTLSVHGLGMLRGETNTLQINVGFLCNQSCRHCHLRAGPDRKENMNFKTAGEVVDYARRSSFETIDITGGAPELNSCIVLLIEELSPLSSRIMVRSNLSALNDGKHEHLFELFKERQVQIVASFPSLNQGQTDSQRGKGIFDMSVSALKKLNSLGYGLEGSGLELNLVSDPTGAFLAPSQAKTEKRFRTVLQQKWGIVFNNLYNFTNMPLGRFRDWLVKSGNLEKYIDKLASAFNPCAVDGVMCRTILSVSWDGYLYDCDFNIVKGLHLGGRKIHVSEMQGAPEPGSSIAVGDHCYTCSAGAGFT